MWNESIVSCKCQVITCTFLNKASTYSLFCLVSNKALFIFRLSAEGLLNCREAASEKEGMVHILLICLTLISPRQPRQKGFVQSDYKLDSTANKGASLDHIMHSSFAWCHMTFWMCFFQICSKVTPEINQPCQFSQLILCSWPQMQCWPSLLIRVHAPRFS